MRAILMIFGIVPLVIIGGALLLASPFLHIFGGLAFGDFVKEWLPNCGELFDWDKPTFSSQRSTNKRRHSKY